jgi:hypothetical protein
MNMHVRPGIFPAREPVSANVGRTPNSGAQDIRRVRADRFACRNLNRQKYASRKRTQGASKSHRTGREYVRRADLRCAGTPQSSNG